MNSQCEFHPDHTNRCTNAATRLVWIKAICPHPEGGWYTRLCEDCFAYAQEWWKGYRWTWEA